MPEYKHLKQHIFTLSSYKPIQWVIYSFKIRRFLRAHGPFLYHAPTYSSILFPPRDVKVLVTVHDLMYRLIPNYFSSYKLINILSSVVFDWFVKLNLYFATKIITISTTTKRDLASITDKKVEIVHHNCDYLYGSRDRSCEPDFIDAPYLIYVGNLRKQKNIPLLINAFKESKKIYFRKLVIVSREHIDINDKNIILLNNVGESELEKLYLNAESSVLPSFYEGFGFPVIESLSCRTNVICSDAGSLAEFPDEFVVFFQSNSRKQLLDILDNWPSYRKDLSRVSGYLNTYSSDNFFNNMNSIMDTLGH